MQEPNFDNSVEYLLYMLKILWKNRTKLYIHLSYLDNIFYTCTCQKELHFYIKLVNCFSSYLSQRDLKDFKIHVCIFIEKIIALNFAFQNQIQKTILTDIFHLLWYHTDELTSFCNSWYYNSLKNKKNNKIWLQILIGNLICTNCIWRHKEKKCKFFQSS